MKAIQPPFSYPPSMYEIGSKITSVNAIYKDADNQTATTDTLEKLSTLEKFYQLFSAKKEKVRSFSFDHASCLDEVTIASSIPKTYSESAECREVRNILGGTVDVQKLNGFKLPPIGVKIEEDEVSAESAYNSSSSLTLSPTSDQLYQRLSVYKNVLNVLGEEEGEESVFDKHDLLDLKTCNESQKILGPNVFKPIQSHSNDQVKEGKQQPAGVLGRLPIFSTPSPSAFLISPLYADFDKFIQSSASATQSYSHFNFDKENEVLKNEPNGDCNPTVQKLLEYIQTTKPLFDSNEPISTKKLNITSPETNNGLVCTVHQGQICLVLCQDCIAPLCQTCLNPSVPQLSSNTSWSLKSHESHTLVYIGNARAILDQHIERVQCTYSKLGERVLHDKQIAVRIEERAKSLDTTIDSMIESRVSALRSRQATLHTRVRAITASKLLSLRDQIGSLTRYQGHLKECLQLTGAAHMFDNCDNDGNVINDILATTRNLKSRLGNVESIMHSLLLPWEDETLDFKASASDPRLLESLLDTLGQIQAPASALNSTLYSMRFSVPPKNALIHKPISLILKTRDHSGEGKISGGDRVTALLMDSVGNKNSISPTDLLNGRYIVSFTPSSLGRHIIEVYIRGKAVANSPLTINIRPSRNYLTIRTAIFSFGKEGTQDGELCRPWGVACDSAGNLFLADRSNNRIQVFDMKGNFIRKFGTFGTAVGQFNRPAGIAVNSRNELIVADKDNHRIQVFTTTGKFLFTFGEKGNKSGQFNYPWDVALNSCETKIVVSDTRNHRIQLFLPDGTLIGKYGLIPPYCRNFDSPRGVTFGHRDEIYVTDFNNHRCLIIDSELKDSKIIGKEGPGLGDFFRPQGVAVDLEGNIIIADSRNHRVQVFDPSGLFLCSFGQNGSHIGEFDRPSGVCLSPEGYIIVVDFGNNRVQIF